MKKNFCTIICVLSMFLFCVPIYSFIGWNIVDGEFVYLNSQGQKLLNAWINSNGHIYYLGEDGFIVKNTLMEYEDNLYFLDREGKRIEGTFAEVDDSVTLDEGLKRGTYYFDDKGRAARRTSDTNFKRIIDGTCYAFDEDGLLTSGWFSKDGTRITDPEYYLSEGVYFADESGRIYKNEWYKFTDDVGVHSLDEQESNITAESYDYMNDIWVYFDNLCEKVHSTGDSAKTRIINGKKYAFDELGVMLEGFEKNKPLSEAQPSNPSLTGQLKLYSFENGEQLSNKWAKVCPSSSLSEQDYNDDVHSWFYVDGSGNVVHNKIKTIDGKKYAFDGIGRMTTGFVYMYVNGLFVSSYKPEDLVRDDFIYDISEGSKLFGSDINDLRFFDLGDDNGKMLTGDVKIELGDGIYDFKFKDGSGIAYGNNGKLKKYRNIYYINGLKLSPLDDMKYGVVKVSNNEYKVVNSSGRIVTGSKKLIKDDYDNYLVVLNDKLAGYVTDAYDKVKLKWSNKPIASISNLPGYYYYDGEHEIKDYIGLAVASGTTYPTADEIDKLPTEMRLNFR